ncbi:MAG: hypothetical protein AB7Q00_11255 [Phycisphaerales bacterium]
MPWFRFAACLAMGLATTVAVAWVGAVLIPLERLGGVVSLDGDHLEPWCLEVRGPSVSRFVWFEKGRVYSKPGVGPSGASSAAVSNWSFATSTRSNPKFTTGKVSMPADIRKMLESGQDSWWAVAEDRRGWPLPAFKGRVYGTMDRASASVYVVEDASLWVPKTPWSGIPSSNALATMRLIPLRVYWPGLVVDVLVLAVAWGVVFAGVRGVWRVTLGKKRSVQGACPKCGYDLRGDLEAGCPECGWNRAGLSEEAPESGPA